MIKVKIDRPSDSIHVIEDGYTVACSENGAVLEVMDEDDQVIAVFREWLYARPVVDDDYEVEEEEEELAPITPAEVLELAAAEFGAPDTASPVHVNSHGAYAPAGDETEDPDE